MNLYLVRHGEAKSKMADPERHLSDKGAAEIRKEASFIAEHFHVRVISILHSSKTRARETAELFAEFIKPAKPPEEGEGLQPMADIYPWVERIYTMHEDTMIVGHLPFLEKLASYLLCQDENKRIITFETGGIACLCRGEESTWFVRWMVSPGMLK